MTEKQSRDKKRGPPKAIVIRGLDKSKEGEVKVAVPNYINVAAYNGDIWVFSNYFLVFNRLKAKYTDKTVERVESNKDAHTHALKI